MKNKKTINRVLQLIRPYTYLVVSILVLAAVTVAATLYSPILIGKGVDCMIEKGLVSFPDLKLVLLQLAVVTAISAISQWVMSLLTNKMTYADGYLPIWKFFRSVIWTRTSRVMRSAEFPQMWISFPTAF